MTKRPLLLLVSVAGLVLSGTTSAVGSPEGNKKADPDDNQGYMLGHPIPTYQWHGCTKTSTYRTPVSLEVGMEEPGKGNKHGKVTWTLTESTTAKSGYVVSWKVKDGWKICGVQAAVLGSNPTATADIAMEIGYTSKHKLGSTVKSGYETIKAKLSKRDLQDVNEPTAGAPKLFSIVRIYHLTVFVKKKK